MNRRRNTQQTQKSAAGQREDQRDQRHGKDRLQNDRTAREAIVAFGQCNEQRQNAEGVYSNEQRDEAKPERLHGTTVRKH